MYLSANIKSQVYECWSLTFMAVLTHIMMVLLGHTVPCLGIQGLPDPAPWELLFISLRSCLRDPQSRVIPNSQPLCSASNVSQAMPLLSIVCYNRTRGLKPGQAYNLMTGAHQNGHCGENKRRESGTPGHHTIPGQSRDQHRECGGNTRHKPV